MDRRDCVAGGLAARDARCRVFPHPRPAHHRVLIVDPASWSSHAAWFSGVGRPQALPFTLGTTAFPSFSSSFLFLAGLRERERERGKRRIGARRKPSRRATNRELHLLTPGHTHRLPVLLRTEFQDERRRHLRPRLGRRVPRRAIAPARTQHLGVNHARVQGDGRHA